MRFSIWQAVKVSNPEHARSGQAGTVQGINPADPDNVAVRFDARKGQNGAADEPEIIELTAVADLQAL